MPDRRSAGGRKVDGRVTHPLYQCWACHRRIEKIGITEIESGWNKFQGRVGIGNEMSSVTVVHCPEHKEGFQGAIEKKLEEALP